MPFSEDSLPDTPDPADKEAISNKEKEAAIEAVDKAICNVLYPCKEIKDREAEWFFYRFAAHALTDTDDEARLDHLQAAAAHLAMMIKKLEEENAKNPRPE